MENVHMKNKSILFAPHPDDEALFAAYTIMREKPLVVIVTDAYIQSNRGEIGCDADTRWQETMRAMEILGSPVIRLGIKDFELDYHQFGAFLAKSLSGFEKIYVPALQEGNYHHDIVNRAARAVFGDRCVEYSTYSKGEFFTKGNKEVVPTEEEFDTKKRALNCYSSQLNLPSTKPHFDAAIDARSEWLVC